MLDPLIELFKIKFSLRQFQMMNNCQGFFHSDLRAFDPSDNENKASLLTGIE